MGTVLSFPTYHERRRQKIKQYIVESFSLHEEPYRSQGIRDMEAYLEMYLPTKEDLVPLPDWVTPDQAKELAATMQPFVVAAGGATWVYVRRSSVTQGGKGYL